MLGEKGKPALNGGAGAEFAAAPKWVDPESAAANMCAVSFQIDPNQAVVRVLSESFPLAPSILCRRRAGRTWAAARMEPVPPLSRDG